MLFHFIIIVEEESFFRLEVFESLTNISRYYKLHKLGTWCCLPSCMQIKGCEKIWHPKLSRGEQQKWTQKNTDMKDGHGGDEGSSLICGVCSRDTKRSELLMF